MDYHTIVVVVLAWFVVSSCACSEETRKICSVNCVEGDACPRICDFISACGNGNTTLDDILGRPYIPEADVCASNQMIPIGNKGCQVSVVGICCQYTRGGTCWKARGQMPPYIGPVQEFFQSPATAVRMAVQAFLGTFPQFITMCGVSID